MFCYMHRSHHAYIHYITYPPPWDILDRAKPNSSIHLVACGTTTNNNSQGVLLSVKATIVPNMNYVNYLLIHKINTINQFLLFTSNVRIRETFRLIDFNHDAVVRG